MAKRFGRATEETWKKMKVRPVSVTRNYSKKPGRIMFPSSHDIIPQPEVEDACFAVLSNLLENKNEVLLTTKPRLDVIRRIAERFAEFKDQLQFRFTITSISDELLKFWEPNAPLFCERLEALKFAFAEKFKTSVSIEPFLDYDPFSLIIQVAPYSTESIWIGKMNYIRRRNLTKHEELYYAEVRANYRPDHLSEIWVRLKDLPRVRFKDSITNALKQ
jgi:DNA repair photolyase